KKEPAQGRLNVEVGGHEGQCSAWPEGQLIRGPGLVAASTGRVPRTTIRVASNNIATTSMVSGTMNTATWVSAWAAILVAAAGVMPAISAATAARPTRAAEA